MMSPILLSIKLIIWKKPVFLETVLNALVFHYLIFFFLCCAGVLEDHDLKTLSSSADESEVQTCFVMSKYWRVYPLELASLMADFLFRGAGNLADLLL